ncbi:MAG: transglutaminase domain-containing protein [Pelomonas sp.]|nr:transglutaminase domain-containing protein [Roseateles sp.]
MNTLNRRRLLQSGAAAGLATLGLPSFAAAEAEHHFDPKAGAWRTFDATTTVEPTDLQGTVQVWVPLPDIDTDFQRTVEHSWRGNAASAQIVADPVRGVRMLYATFEAGQDKPSLSVTSRVRTRNRSVDWAARAPRAVDPAVLQAALAATELIPTDGIVRKTALEATRGAHADVDKVRAIYDWVVTNAHRDPGTRGCGIGDIASMLESGNLGGKCADLNAIFVGLCRASGIPARDLYGVRLAPSQFGYRELGANPAKLTGAQHCRAEVFLKSHGWVAMDPADVLKVMRQETPNWIKDARDPLVAPVDKALFGAWEGNWMAYNRGADITLPHQAGKATLPFLMYPQGRNASGRFDEYAPDQFKYAISAREVTA